MGVEVVYLLDESKVGGVGGFSEDLWVVHEEKSADGLKLPCSFTPVVVAVYPVGRPRNRSLSVTVIGDAHGGVSPVLVEG